MTVERASAADKKEQDLIWRTNEILRFLVDRGLVDLFVGEDGEFEFAPALCPRCPLATGSP